MTDPWDILHCVDTSMIPGRAPSILVVDEQRAQVRHVQATLQQLGYHVCATASTSEEGLAAAAQWCPDLILLDVRVKGTYDWLQTAEVFAKTLDIPLVFLGKRLDKAVVERGVDGAAYSFVCKPVKPQELRTAIEDAVYRHAVERQLRCQERWFVATLQSISDAVIDVDLSGNVIFMNAVAERVTGVSLDVCAGRPIRDFIRHRDVSDAADPSDSVLETVTANPQEAMRTPSIKQDLEMEKSAAHVFDREQLLEPVMVFSDLTEPTQEGKQPDVSDRLAALGRITASVAHDINNPLSVILANTSVGHNQMSSVLIDLENGTIPAASVVALRGLLEMYEETLISATRISRIVNELKVFGRSEESQCPGSKVEQAVNWAVRTTAHELRQRARVVTDIGDVGDVRLDESRLAQVLVNLLLNAAQAIPAGEQQTKEVRITARQQQRDVVTLEVADTGNGMSPDVLARIFEPFFTTKASTVGTGLGLPICLGIVRSVGGTIAVESIAGLGSKFTLTLPAVATQELPRHPEPSSAVFRPSRILVIDNEPLVARTVRRALKGNEVVCVETTRAALHLLSGGESFDFILCEMMMPEMNAVDLYNVLMRTQPADAQRMIFLSGGALTSQVAAFLATVSNPRLPKPFRVDELRALVQRVVHDTTAHPGAVSHPPEASTRRLRQQPEPASFHAVQR